MQPFLLLAVLALTPELSSGASPAEEPVPTYVQADHNAGATPFKGEAMWRAFHGQAGVDRVVDHFVASNRADPRISDIFRGQDYTRLARVLKEQFCFILNGGCHYSGRDMRSAHRDMGVQQADMGALVENLQSAMTTEHISFASQNRFLAKLAPMKRDVVSR